MFNVEQDSYKALRGIWSERTTQVIAWAGSGLSAPAGLPTWPGIQRTLEVSISRKTETLEEPDARRLRGRLNEIRATANPWRRFSLIEDTLGPTTFKDIVKEALAPALRATPPKAYELLWRLRIGGLLDLNLDRLATRAYQQLNSGSVLNEFAGHDAGSYVHVLKSPAPFVVNLHGTAEDSRSWVWTHGQLEALLSSPGYQMFISACLASRVVLFLGVTADDVATGGHLERLVRSGIDSGTHFWATDRGDLATDQWAEAAGIRVIRYTAKGSDHSELLEMLEDLMTFVPPGDSVAPPVTPQVSFPSDDISTLPTPEILAREDPERVRVLLNAQAAQILAPQTEAAYNEYAEFCRRYDRAIHNAWYITTDGPANKLLTYRLTEEIGEGAFGRVFKALTPDGDEVAIKVLHEEVRRKRGMLESFRRGVRSMRILSERGVPGMVPYHEASEIPALAVMDFVDGYDLKQAVSRRIFRNWSDILRVSAELARIIRTGHMLPERVLHRDIRPSNVMLKMIDFSSSEWTVVVLDFDLSWHRGALEKSVAGPSAAYGYLAPEQLGLSEASTRHAAVDSYGLGMTFRFICTGTDPVPGQQQHVDWQTSLRREVAERRCSEWYSVPSRFARLIDSATRHEQHERWDVGQILAELERLWQAVEAPEDVASAELWAEELLVRSAIAERFEWDPNELAANFRLVSGVGVRVAGDEVKSAIHVVMNWSLTGTEERRNVSKWIGRASDQATAKLRSAGWRADNPSLWTHSATISAEVSVATAQRNYVRLAEGLSRAVGHLKFE